MSTAAVNPEGAGIAAWWAHHEKWWWKAFLIMGVCAVVLQVVGLAKSVLDWTLAIGILVVITMNIWSLLTHFTRLCAVCLDRMPADGQRIAEKKVRTLANYHRTHTVKASFLALIPIIGLPMFFKDNVFYQAAINGLIWGWFSYTAYLDYFHRPLVPFCPYCDWGGGDGPHEHVPDPDPSMIKTA